jgi:hypothetical protein
MARPTKLTSEVRDAILASIEAGAYAEQAARAAGIAPSTFYAWRERGEAGEEPFLEFVEALRAREAIAEIVAVTVLRDAAAGGDWRAAAHFLERRFPQRWRRHDSTEITTVEPATRAEVTWAEISSLDDEALDGELAILGFVKAGELAPPREHPDLDGDAIDAVL